MIIESEIRAVFYWEFPQANHIKQWVDIYHLIANLLAIVVN